MLIVCDAFASNDEDCRRIAQMEIYSSAFASKETGDLLGYELAIEKKDDPAVQAHLFIYEGAQSDSFSIPGQISGKELTAEGKWDEHRIEYPSKKEIIVTHDVKIHGTLDSKWFRGTLTIIGLQTPGSVRLKRVRRIWTCR
jgi:hypothetical protein